MAGDLSNAELTLMLARLRHDRQFRDELTTHQLVNDALCGLKSPDNGYGLRIIAKLSSAKNGD